MEWQKNLNGMSYKQIQILHTTKLHRAPPENNNFLYRTPFIVKMEFEKYKYLT